MQRNIFILILCAVFNQYISGASSTAAASESLAKESEAARELRLLKKENAFLEESFRDFRDRCNELQGRCQQLEAKNQELSDALKVEALEYSPEGDLVIPSTVEELKKQVRGFRISALNAIEQLKALEDKVKYLEGECDRCRKDNEELSMRNARLASNELVSENRKLSDQYNRLRLEIQRRDRGESSNPNTELQAENERLLQRILPLEAELQQLRQYAQECHVYFSSMRP